MITQAIVTIGFLFLAFDFNACANDRDRIDAVEQEILQLKARLSRLESVGEASIDVLDSSKSFGGWKSISNWRKLTIDMSPNDVQRILGEPERLDGGQVTIWYYKNDGRVVFMRGKTSQWTEPTIVK